MDIYIDNEYRCHVTNDGTMRKVQTDFFDGKCDSFIEGYRYIPEGETWTRSDGMDFTGEMIAPLRDYDVLVAVQGENDKTQQEILVLTKAGAEQVRAYCNDTGNPPKEDGGIFVKGVEPWEAGQTYERFDLFSHGGVMGYAKQTHVAQEEWPPFSTGTEALYGARPAPDTNGVYPYVYNMAASRGMRVRDPNGGVYECTMDISDMLYPPSMIPAHFMGVAE